MTFGLWRIVILWISVTVFCTATACGQATIHVPADQPTIQAGINAANNGDTVLVAPGTYTENIDFKGKSITVTSGATSYAGAAATVIQAPAVGPVVILQSGETPAAVLNGFTLTHGMSAQGSITTGDGIDILNASPTLTNNVISGHIGCSIDAFNASSLLVEGNHVLGQVSSAAPSPCGTTVFPDSAQGQSTIQIVSSGNVKVIGNLIENNQSFSVSGISISGTSNTLLQNNTVRFNVASGASVFMYSPIQSLQIIQNLVYDNATILTAESGTFEGAGPAGIEIFQLKPLTPPPTLIVVNNTVYENEGPDPTIGVGPSGSASQFLIQFPFGPSTIANNLFVGFGGEPPVYCDAPSIGNSPIAFIDNDAYNAFTGGPQQSSPCGPAGQNSGTLSVDPQFLNPAAYDFHTQPTSPIVAAGDINAPLIPSADLDSKARTVCGTIDMGVYEVRPHPPIVLQTSANPIVGGNPVTFTAKITGNCNVPTGTVTFLDGTTVLGSVVLDGNASASLVAPSLFVGTHNITVTYPGDFNFEDSISNTVVEVVTGFPSTTSMSAAPNPASAFQSITLSATVSSAFGTPIGTVAFMTGGVTVATATLNSSGIATAVVSTLGAGTYSITAVYSGSTDYAVSTSAPVLEKVVGAETTVSLLASPNPVIFGQTLTLTATVAATQGNGVPAGSVTFLDGTQTLGSAPLSTKGIAVFPTSSLALGTHNITVSYAGSSNANASISNLVSVAVIPIPASIGLTATPNPANFGQTVTFTASVAAAGTPSGAVTFFDQGTSLGSVVLNASGAASFATSTLIAGKHQITATFNPTGPYGTSTSAPLSETILDYDFSLSASTTSLTIPGGGYQILSVTVTPIGGFPGTVSLGCSALPVHTLCNFKPSTTSPLSKGSQAVQFTLNTSDVLGYGQKVGTLSVPGFPSRHNSSLQFAGILLPLMMLGGFTGTASRRCNSQVRRLLLIVAAACMSLNIAACSGQLPGVTPPGTYTVTVIGTDTDPTSNIVHSVNLQLTVTP